MLVLSRNIGQSIKIHMPQGVVRILVMNTDGAVRLGIDAPREIFILKEELKNNKQLTSLLASRFESKST